MACESNMHKQASQASESSRPLRSKLCHCWTYVIELHLVQWCSPSQSWCGSVEPYKWRQVADADHAKSTEPPPGTAAKDRWITRDHTPEILDNQRSSIVWQ